VTREDFFIGVELAVSYSVVDFYQGRLCRCFRGLSLFHFMTVVGHTVSLEGFMDFAFLSQETKKLHV